jgi:predicted CoA-substrate-specific enzyme activase
MYTLGIDIGSTATKGVILRDGNEIITMAKVNVGTGTSGSQRVMDGVLSQGGLCVSDIKYIVATGYGRNRFELANHQVSELSCHTRGVSYLVPDVRTIIDIGGQDAKTIKVNDRGMMESFVMNEKCAAGTGRFLDVMAGILETTVDQLGTFSAQATLDMDISATCTVFAESEVISLLSNGVSIPNIVAAIHKSVAKRVCGLARRAGVAPRLVMTGGVAQNSGVVQAIEKELNLPVTIPLNPQMTGALGAALFAYEALLEKESAV